jgi:hypothetical protein
LSHFRTENRIPPPPSRGQAFPENALFAAAVRSFLNLGHASFTVIAVCSIVAAANRPKDLSAQRSSLDAAPLNIGGVALTDAHFAP